MVIDINPELEEFSGIYVLDGVEIPVYIDLRPERGDFRIFNINDRDNGQIPSFYRLAYFGGTYKLRWGKLRYTLQPYWQEQTGYKTIIFEKIEDYDPPEDRR